MVAGGRVDHGWMGWIGLRHAGSGMNPASSRPLASWCSNFDIDKSFIGSGSANDSATLL